VSGSTRNLRFSSDHGFLERILLAGSFAQEGHRLLARLVQGEDVGASEEYEALTPIDPVCADVNAASARVDPKAEALECLVPVHALLLPDALIGEGADGVLPQFQSRHGRFPFPMSDQGVITATRFRGGCGDHRRTLRFAKSSKNQVSRGPGARSKYDPLRDLYCSLPRTCHAEQAPLPRAAIWKLSGTGV